MILSLLMNTLYLFMQSNKLSEPASQPASQPFATFLGPQ